MLIYTFRFYLLQLLLASLGSNCLTLRAEATFSLCELSCEKQPLLTTIQFSIMHVRNSSCNSPTKLIVGSIVMGKWHQFCGNKKIVTTATTTLICHTRLTQCSNSVKNRKNPVFQIYLSRFLDGFEWLLAEATFRTQAQTIAS